MWVLKLVFSKIVLAIQGPLQFYIKENLKLKSYLCFLIDDMRQINQNSIAFFSEMKNIVLKFEYSEITPIFIDTNNTQFNNSHLQ